MQVPSWVWSLGMHGLGLAVSSLPCGAALPLERVGEARPLPGSLLGGDRLLVSLR